MSTLGPAGYRLPLSPLRAADACHLTQRIAAFEAQHGVPPDEDTTLAMWWAVTPSMSDRVWAVAEALPLVYPHRRDDLLRVVVEVAYLAASRVQPERSDDPRPGEALALVRRWLDGEDVSADELRAAASAAWAAVIDKAAWAAAARAADAAADAARAAARAAHAAWAAARAADRAAEAAAEAAADRAAECARQRADLDRLLADLNLEGP